MKMTRTTTENLNRDIGFIKDVESAKQLEVELMALQEKIKTKKRELLGNTRKFSTVPPEVMQELVALYSKISCPPSVEVVKEVKVSAKFYLQLPHYSGSNLLALAENAFDNMDSYVHVQSTYGMKLNATDFESKLVVDEIESKQDRQYVRADGFEAVLSFDEFETEMESFIGKLKRFYQLLSENDLLSNSTDIMTYLAAKAKN